MMNQDTAFMYAYDDKQGHLTAHSANSHMQEFKLILTPLFQARERKYLAQL